MISTSGKENCYIYFKAQARMALLFVRVLKRVHRVQLYKTPDIKSNTNTNTHPLLIKHGV